MNRERVCVVNYTVKCDKLLFRRADDTTATTMVTDEQFRMVLTAEKARAKRKVKVFRGHGIADINVDVDANGVFHFAGIAE